MAGLPERQALTDHSALKACLVEHPPGCWRFRVHCFCDPPVLRGPFGHDISNSTRPAAPQSKTREAIALLNQKFFVIRDYGGHYSVGSFDDSGRLHVQRERDFKSFFANRFVERKSGDKIARLPLGRVWWESPQRLQYEGVVFDPSGPQVLPGNILNLWRGFPVKPQEGDCSRILDHIFIVLAAGDREAFDDILDRFAWKIQNPGGVMETALVFRGEKGCGKGIILRLLARIFGPHGLHITQRKHLTGNFNSHLEQCAFLFADEAFFAGNHDDENVLKGLITEPSCSPNPSQTGAKQERPAKPAAPSSLGENTEGRKQLHHWEAPYFERLQQLHHSWATRWEQWKGAG